MITPPTIRQKQEEKEKVFHGFHIPEIQIQENSQTHSSFSDTQPFDYTEWMNEDDVEEDNLHGGNETLGNLHIHSMTNQIPFFIEDDSQSDMDHLVCQIENYELNYTIKQLISILDYYGFQKNRNQFKKSELISHILLFENNPENYLKTMERKKKWFYLNQIAEDKQLKKYLLGWK